MKYAKAGYGVFFNTNDPRNISQPVPSELPQTNNVAELLAIDAAIQTVHNGERTTIYSDSQYSINSVTKWAANWKENNWRNSGGYPV